MALDVCPRAMLLLDRDLDEPWACGHNIRMELQREAGKGGVPMPQKLWSVAVWLVLPVPCGCWSC